MEAVKLPPWLAELDVRRVARRGLLVLAGVAAVSLGWHFHESAGDLKGGILQPAPPPEPDREEPLPLQVEVRTVPSGAEVRYGGTVLGITPCVVRLPEGKREIELRRAGYRRDKRMVDVHIGAQVRVKLLR